VVALHGYSGDAQGMERGTGLSAAADRLGFIAVYPDGVSDIDANRYWNSVGNVGKSPDDVLFISLLLDELQQSACVDPERIFATGFSNGGGMTGVLMCRLSHRIAAFAPIAGNFYGILGGCTTERAISVLEVHGTADDVIPYDGIPPAQEPAYPLPAIPNWLTMWASHDSCATGPEAFLQASDAVGERWTGCADGAEVAHYRIEGGGHAIPASIGGRPLADVVWSFFAAHPLR
jgi:polyhydroxybutyrate depolymerase